MTTQRYASHRRPEPEPGPPVTASGPPVTASGPPVAAPGPPVPGSAQGGPGSGTGRHRTEIDIDVDGPDERIAVYRASAQAHAAVGCYGDPTAAWSVLMSAHLTGPIDPVEVGDRLAELCREYPHLGAPPTVGQAPSADMLRSTFATRPYALREPLVRVAVGSHRPDILIAAHHGAVDGLGMVALLGAALGQSARTAATGLGDRPARRSFAAASVKRLGEALFTPPTRLHREPAGGDATPDSPRWREEIMLDTVLPRHAIGTTATVAAAAAVAAAWNTEHGVGHDRMVVGVGASRRGDVEPQPLHRALYVRLPVPSGADRRTVQRLLSEQPPEPDFPAGGALSRLAVRMLAGRLGATFLVSNLGVIDLGETVRSVAFHPVVSGPAGVAFGAVTTGSTTTMTIRTRRRDFSPNAAATLLDSLISVLPAPRPVRPSAVV